MLKNLFLVIKTLFFALQGQRRLAHENLPLRQQLAILQQPVNDHDYRRWIGLLDVPRCKLLTMMPTLVGLRASLNLGYQLARHISSSCSCAYKTLG
jgi:hypothetical protein